MSKKVEKIKYEKISKERSKEILKKRQSVVCECKKQKIQSRDRVKFGTCRCDGYSFSYTAAAVLANSLYQYIADGSQAIMRDDWSIIEKHADAIRDYADADPWDLCNNDKPDIRHKYLMKEKAFREALHWLSENWQGLWW